MSSAQVVGISVTLNSLPEDYSHPEGHNNQTVSTPGFEPFAICYGVVEVLEHLEILMDVQLYKAVQ